MIIKEEPEGVVLQDPDSFNLKQIFTCGQCFRWNEVRPDVWRGIALGRFLEIETLSANSYLFRCTKEDFDKIWLPYFDLERDYTAIKKSVCGDLFLEEAVKWGSGIRILQQDPFEMLITFIISQCNNIPKIKTTIFRLCERLGQPLDTNCGRYFLFPSPEALFNNPHLVLNSGVGFRAKYIISAAEKVINGELNLNNLIEADREMAFRELTTLPGVGSKVANCVLLFGLRHLDGFPEDLWIKKVLAKHYDGKFDSNRYNGYKGIIQQYLFYYGRHLGTAYFS